MNKNNQLVVVIVGVVIIIGAYYYFTSQPAASTTPEVATTTATSTTPVAAPAKPTATKYSNPELGFSFMMPAAWKVEDGSATRVEFFNDNGLDNETNKLSTVSVNVNTAHYTLAALKDAEQKKHGGEVVYEGATDFTLAGEPAFIEHFDGMAPVDYVYTIHKGYVYELSGVIADLVYDTGNQAGFTFTR